MTENTRHETLDVAELRRLLDVNRGRYFHVLPWHAWDRGIGYELHVGATCRDEMEPRGYCEEVNNGFRETFGAPEAELIVAAVNALPALLDAAAERDRLAEAVERVRALHGPRVLQVLGATCSAEECDHEDACPLVDYTVCGHCYDVGDGAHPYAYEEGGLQDVAHPCATYRALDATPETGCES